MINDLLICPEVIDLYVLGRLSLGFLPFGGATELACIFILEPPHFQERVAGIISFLRMVSVCSWTFRAIALLLEMRRLHLAFAILVILFDLFLEVGLRFVLVQCEMAVIFLLRLMRDRVWLRTRLRLRL